MRSLFLNSLLVDNDRNLREGYVTFSRDKVHAPERNPNDYDRPKATVGKQRENFSFEAKKLAKTMSLEKSLLNITNYVSLIDRARETLRSVESKLELLEDIINQSSGAVDPDDYKQRIIGAIAGVDVSGRSAIAGTFENITGSSTSGFGRGASFSIKGDGLGNYSVTNINSNGLNYKVDDVITINGDLVGGETSENNVTIVVKSISSQYERVLLDEEGEKIVLATDDIDRLSLQLEANNLVSEITAIINNSEFWDEEIFGGLKAFKHAQVGHQIPETTLIDIQKLTTIDLGNIREADFLNPDFSINSDIEGTLATEVPVTSSGTVTSLYGWNIGLNQVALGPFNNGSDAANGSIQTTIGGASTPTDPTPTPSNNDSPVQTSTGDDSRISGGNFSYSISGSTIKLTSNDLKVNGGNVAHGPFLISDNAVDLNAGDKVSFNWRADATTNAFDVYSYLLNATTGDTVELVDQFGDVSTSTAAVETTITTDGLYYFIFVAGTFDYDFIGTLAETSSISGNSNILGVTSASIAGTANGGIAPTSFTNVGQVATSGLGSGASFSVALNIDGTYSLNEITRLGSNYAVNDTVTISGASLGGLSPVNDATLTINSVGSKTFFNIQQSSTSGSGNGGIFQVSIDGTGGHTVDRIVSGGSGYEIGDTITIAGNRLGGTTITNDLNFSVSDVVATAGSTAYISNISIERITTSDDTVGGVDLSTQAAATAAATVVGNAIKQIKYRDSYLAGKKLALQGSLNAITSQSLVSTLPLPPAGDIELHRSVRELKRVEIINEVLKQVQSANAASNLNVLSILST